MEEARMLIEQNDIDLKKREDELIQKVNTAYEKAIKMAVVDFKYLEKLNPKIKPSSAQVRKIVERVIESFSQEFNELTEPFQKELVLQYTEGLKEASQLLALRDLKSK
jgi:DNA-directed RNA polymerase specialized sigma24 family protein